MPFSEPDSAINRKQSGYLPEFFNKNAMNFNLFDIVQIWFHKQQPRSATITNGSQQKILHHKTEAG